MQEREGVWHTGDFSICIACLVLFSVSLIGQDAGPTIDSRPQSAPAQQSPPVGNVPRSSLDTASAPQESSDAPRQPVEKDDVGMFVLRKQVSEVALHATVIDDKDHIVTVLDRSAFIVFEDEHPQPITSFRREDIPVSMGILIDNSGSMREKRAKVDSAALNLVRASNAADQIMVVNFNEEGILDQDFTSDIGKLREALNQHESRGLTALYDALNGAAIHLRGSSTHEKKVIFVVTDGQDNASHTSLEKVLQSLQEEGAPTVYAIGILGEEKQERARQDLQALARRTGGIAFFPKTLDEVDQISRTVAHDIRSQYAIGYKPSKPRSAGGYRAIRVEARASGYHNLRVRTRHGYDATQSPDQNSAPISSH